MDIPCPKCGEPWENESLHDIATEIGSTYKKVWAEFQDMGCEVFAPLGVPPCKADDRAMIRAAIADLLGDDVDGYASEMNDMEWLLK